MSLQPQPWLSGSYGNGETTRSARLLLYKNTKKKMGKIEITETDRVYMNRAAELAEESVRRGGGPFGAVIVHDGHIVAEGMNTVTLTNDPTAHAEINAIRMACQDEETYSLHGCIIYSSCEPCPMCLSALYWAGVERIYYGNTQEDAEAIDFSDRFIYRQLELPASERAIPQIRIMEPRTLRAFKLWEKSPEKRRY